MQLCCILKLVFALIIDGRVGGVRESLENQTMRMAENAAKLISENLKYPDGTPVQCVIGCTTIGGGAEVPAWQSSSLPRMLRQRCL